MSLPSERSRGRWRWPMIAVGLLVTHVACMLVAVSIAVSDPSAAPLPDYYGDSLRWDDERAALRAAEEAGLVLTATAATITGPGGKRALVLSLLGPEGVPAQLDDLELAAFHPLDAGRVIRQPLELSADGQLRADLPMGRAGAWELSLRGRLGEVPVAFERQLMIAAVEFDR